MSESKCQEFIATKEHRRFVEFCDACKRFRYIGLCYGSPGVGKTVSACRYANWDRVRACRPLPCYVEPSSEEPLICDTVVYTPMVANTPSQIERDIQQLRHTLHLIRHQPIDAEEHEKRRELREQIEQQPYRPSSGDDQSDEHFVEEHGPFRKIVEIYEEKRCQATDPTSLIIVDESDRLRMSSLEQVRDIFDRGDVGIVLIGMPGMEKRLSRYPQLYSRVGFVHVFRPLKGEELKEVFAQGWAPSSASPSPSGLGEEQVIATISRITGGNFRLLQRLLTQTVRLMEINGLDRISPQVIEAARESLVIGVG